MNGLLKVIQALLTLFVKSAGSSQEVSQKKDEVKSTPELKPAFKSDSERLKSEYDQLKTKNNHLYNLLHDICIFCSTNFNKTVVITMIYRTEAEQDSIYKDDPKYKVRKFKSPHQFWQAIDLRSRTFTPDEINKLVNYINTIYNKTNHYAWTAKNHNVGLGDHFHIQYNKKV